MTSEQQIDTTASINLGAALDLIARFMNDVARTGGPLTEKPEYVAAKLAIDRLTAN